MLVDEKRVDIEERIKILDRDIENGFIQPKNMAKLAILFYKNLKEYNENNLVEVLKKVISFFNNEMNIFPEKKEIYNLKQLEEKVKIFYKKIKENYPLKTEDRKEYDLGDEFEIVFEILKTNFQKLESKKPIFFKRKWKKQIYEIQLNLLLLTEKIELSRNQKNKIIEEKEIENESIFEDINRILKEFLKSFDGGIGIRLAELKYNEISESKNNLDIYIMKNIIEELYLYYIQSID